MKKRDFIMVVKVENCNPNGDPLNEGRPRTDLEGYGEITAECIKRKIRNRLQDMGENVFVQSDDRCQDGYNSLQERAMSFGDFKKVLKENRKEDATIMACGKWIDVRLFGQVFAYSSSSSGVGISLGIRGAVSICHSRSLAPISVKDIQIAKSVNGEPTKNGGKSSDRLGMRYLVDHSIYVIKGSINPFFCEKNGVTEEDLQLFKAALVTLFENDESSARPAGSMEVLQVYWVEQDDKNFISTAKIHNAVEVDMDGTSFIKELPDSVKVEELIK